MKKLWQSGLIFTALSLVSGAGNFVFQGIMGRRFSGADGEYGLVNAMATFMNLLGLPLLIASTAVVHHIAHFRGSNDEARLQGLLAGCRSFLLKLTVAVSIAAFVVIQPLSSYFNVPRASLTVAALVCLIIGLWGTYAVALCQGMGWFKRLALIGLAGVCLKTAFVWLATLQRPVAEVGVFAIGVGALANFAVFFWWRDLFRPGERVSPWQRDFFQYLAVAAAGVGAQYCFTQGDMLVAKKYFAGEELDAYGAAGRIASALHLAVSPLLTVLFTARSSERHGKSIGGPLGLLLLYAAGLSMGALTLFFARDLCVQLLFGKAVPLASQMIGRYAITMAFVGLIQALGMWALASHWLKIGILYGALGLTYWLTLLNLGKTPEKLLQVMPLGAACGFAVMFAMWIFAIRTSKNDPSQASTALAN